MDIDKRHNPENEVTPERLELAKAELALGSSRDAAADSPTVDRDLLRRYLDDELPAELDSIVEANLRRYRSWLAALDELEIERSQPRPLDQSPS